MVKTNTIPPSLVTDLSERISWNSDFQTRRLRYRRLMALSKRASIFLGTRFPNAVPLLFVLGHPKSGTTWTCQLLADYFRIPLPQFSILPLGCSAVLQSVEAPSKKYQHGVYVMRDGRDVMVSLYFHMRGRVLSGSSTPHQKKMLEGLDLNAAPRDNMEPFMGRLIKRPSGGWTKLANWGEHVGAHLAMEHARLPTVRYEELLVNGEQALSILICDLTGGEPDVGRVRESLQRNSFQKQSGRRPGDEDRESSLRKGQAGDWVNHFSKTAAELFDHLFGDTLIKAGYATDHTWVQDVE
jgi:hypothetical protein